MAITPDAASENNLNRVRDKLNSVICSIDKELSAKYFGDMLGGMGEEGK